MNDKNPDFLKCLNEAKFVYFFTNKWVPSLHFVSFGMTAFQEDLVGELWQLSCHNSPLLKKCIRVFPTAGRNLLIFVCFCSCNCIKKMRFESILRYGRYDGIPKKIELNTSDISPFGRYDGIFVSELGNWVFPFTKRNLFNKCPLINPLVQ